MLTLRNMSALFAMFLIHTLAATPVQAVVTEGVQFPPNIQVDNQTLVLNGTGVRRATLLKVKVYVGGLYVPTATTSAADILQTSVPKRFVGVFKRDVDAKKGADAFKTALEQVTQSAGSDQALKAEITQFERWIPAFAETQILTATFKPNDGIVVQASHKADAFKGSVALGTALFGIWVGPNAIDAGLRSGLLAGGNAAP